MPCLPLQVVLVQDLVPCHWAPPMAVLEEEEAILLHLQQQLPVVVVLELLLLQPKKHPWHLRQLPNMSSSLRH